MVRRRSLPAEDRRTHSVRNPGQKQEQKRLRARSQAKPVFSIDLPRPSRVLIATLCLALCLATVAVYVQIYRCGFIAYDDDRYVYENGMVQQGLTSSGVAWAFTTFSCANWHPLTWLSHMLDCRLFGLNPGGHHLVNLGFHLASTVLLFLAFVRMTRRPWRSAVVAGIFAIHPVHVESVAWVAERKDVLSTFLGMLALLFYVRYAENPRIRRMVPVVVVFALGLMAKPMLVTFPFVLLLVDIWPLRRLPWPPAWSTLKTLIVEKILLFAMAAAVSAVTLVAQRGVVSALADLPFSVRFENAVTAYIGYIVKAFWPAKLAVLYPYETHSAEMVLAALIILIAATAAAFALARKRPYLLVGWLWYLGMLVPVIGLVHVGAQSMADRYTYLPLVGLSLGIVWFVADLVEGRRVLTSVSAAVACAVLLTFAVLAYRQMAYWKSSTTLFERTLAVTKRNFIMLNNMGVILERDGNEEQAKAHYMEALSYRPDYADAHKNLAIILAREGKRDEAIDHYRAAIASQPGYAQAHNNLGVLLAEIGKTDEAISHYRAAIVAQPDYARAHANLAHELMNLGELDEAYLHLATAVRLMPQSVAAQADLGILLAAQGKYDEARSRLETCLEMAPDQPEVQSKLGFVLLKLGRVDEAIAHCREALRLKPDYAEARYNLGLALDAAGKKGDAMSELMKALTSGPGRAVPQGAQGQSQAPK